MACLTLACTLARSFDACLINMSGAAHAADASESAACGIVYIVQVKRMVVDMCSDVRIVAKGVWDPTTIPFRGVCHWQGCVASSTAVQEACGIFLYAQYWWFQTGADGTLLT